MTEEWKEVTGYPNYLVSNMGRIISKERTIVTEGGKIKHYKRKLLKPYIERNGRLMVDLANDGKHKAFFLHRLIANEFLEPLIDTDMTVNHKDGNKKNNCIENLEWLTNGDNIRHGFDNGLFSFCVKCKLIDKNGESHEFRSMLQASRFLGRNSGYVRKNISVGRRLTDISGEEYKFEKV